jgi:AcrR family transcriptional regulator
MDRRARKKAETRELVRSVARSMFAECGFDAVTTADIARTADVAVQTVFNHFSTKEELFFDGRTPWVEGPADSVQLREPSVAPLSALRAYLVDACFALVESMSTPERRCYAATLEASEALRARERELVFESERLLTEALLDAWTTAPGHGQDAPPDPRRVVAVTAAMWLSAARVMVAENRALVAGGADAAELARDVREMASCLFAEMEAAFAVVAGRVTTPSAEDTGGPHVTSSPYGRPAPARRAG